MLTKALENISDCCWDSN